MRKVLTGIILTCLLLCIGCRGEKDARLYAAKLNEVLKSYQEQVNQKIDAEQSSYKELAKIYSEVRETDIYATLALERTERAEQMSDDFIGGDRKTLPTRSEIKGRLANYALLDFEQTRGLLGQESDAYVKYLERLEKLEADSADIEALSQSLDELAKPKKPLDQLKGAATFGECVKKELGKLDCIDLNKPIEAQDKKVKEIQANVDKETDAQKKEMLKQQLAIATAALDALNKQKTDKKCEELAKVNCSEIDKDAPKDDKAGKSDKKSSTAKITP